ncbi:PqqD family protein [Nakamurella leprariae]|uniref:PqqD family protein n=1 Tax=Nakamurella leprariae TaxID=2803911 RepID=A0A939C0U2_9ACTN|nr:PqqD family protein [Nakamurella leprariae]MBM9469136.1 PqqD family protein [Nakamurella leprariae]
MTAVLEPVLHVSSTVVAWRTIGESTVLLDLAASAYYGLNRTGTRLWSLLADGATHTALVDALLEVSDHRIDRCRADADVVAFLAELRTSGLLDQAPDQPHPAFALRTGITRLGSRLGSGR